MTGQDFIAEANKHIGETYILGSLAPKNNPDFKGPWDCAEFVSYIVYQVTKKLYGCINDDSQHPEKADAGTIYWATDVDLGHVISIPVEEARATPGAILLREAGQGLDGHIVFSQGDGSTTEAHGHADGLVHNRVDGRRWTTGILIPGVTYTVNHSQLQEVVHPVILHVGASNEVPAVQNVQEALVARGYEVTVDGIYGPNTAKAVRAFQNTKGLTPDGEVGPLTMKALMT